MSGRVHQWAKKLATVRTGGVVMELVPGIEAALIRLSAGSGQGCDRCGGHLDEDGFCNECELYETEGDQLVIPVALSAHTTEGDPT